MTSSNLQIQLNSNGIHIGERLHRHIDRGVERLAVWTKKFPKRHVRMSITKRERDGAHRVELVLELPQKTIVASEEVPNLTSAVDRAFRKATRQLREFKAVLRRDHLHTRVRQTRGSMQPLTEDEMARAAQERNMEHFRATLQDRVKRLERFLRAEIRNLRKGSRRRELSVQDLVDETLATALEHFDDKPVDMPSDQWLYGMALDVMERNLRQAQVERDAGMGPIEDDDVPAPRGLVEDLLDGFLVDAEVREQKEEPEAPTVDSRMAGPGPDDPAEAAERHELEERVAAVLRELPRSWHRSFTLHFLEGFGFQEIAQIQNLPEAQIRFQVQSSELFVRERLGELALPG